MRASFGVALFIGGTLASKWMAIASLASISGATVVAWLATECTVLLMLRKVVEGKISPPVTNAAAESVGRHLRQLARLIEEDSHKSKVEQNLKADAAAASARVQNQKEIDEMKMLCIELDYSPPPPPPPTFLRLGDFY